MNAIQGARYQTHGSCGFGQVLDASKSVGIAKQSSLKAVEIWCFFFRVGVNVELRCAFSSSFKSCILSEERLREMLVLAKCRRCRTERARVWMVLYF